MDLQVYAVIVIVFLVSLCSLLFINKQLRGGKTFEEVLAEKRQFADKLYGNTGGKSANKKNAKKLNTNNNKKKDKNNKKNLDKQAENEPQSDSGSGDDANLLSSPDSQKLHVEFSEAEIIESDTNTVTVKKQLSTGKRGAQQPNVRKNSSTKPPGSSILVNKNDSARSSISNVAIDLNHFEESQPRDDLEVRRHRDESATRVLKKDQKKGGAGGKHNNKKDSPKVTEKVPVPIVTLSDAVDAQPLAAVVNEIVTATAVAVQKESPKNQPNKDKQNKKKKNEALLVQKLVDAGVASTTTDDVNVNVIMQFLGRTELTRSEIQILIDFLLNKQQDTINVTNCDWSDDIVQKLRKQLEEKDRQLSEEQTASVALHAKLRELRAELNGERILANQRVNANAEKLATLTEELHQLQQDYQVTTERAANDKKALEFQLKQHQAKLFQEKQLQGQEATQKLQQLTETNASLTTEILSKNALVQELQEKFLHMRDDSIGKLADYEQKFQEYVRQSEADVAHLTGENQRLRAECARKDEYEKLYAIQKFDLEKLEARLAEQSKASNHLDDTSKVEIRNLQNALDSTKTELSLSRKDATEASKTIGDLAAQVNELKHSLETATQLVQAQHTKEVEDLKASIQTYQSLIVEKDTKLSEFKSKLESQSSSQRENELFEQLSVYKDKNNDLRQKNWKLVDALRSAEDKASKSSSSNHSNLVTNNHAAERVVALTEEQVRTKEILERLFPNAVSKATANNHQTDDYTVWLTTITKHIENFLQQQTNSIQQLSNSKSKTVTNNHRDNGNVTDVVATDDGAKQITEELILQNAKLKSTVDEYKTIVAETESVLTNLEKKVKEQDSYWRNVVNSKDNEIQNLKVNPVAVNSNASS